MEKILTFGSLILSIMILAGGFVSAKLYFNIGGTPADVITLRYGVSAFVVLPFIVAYRNRLVRNPGWWRAVGLAAVGGAPFGVFVFIGVTGAPITHGAGIVPALVLVIGTLLAYFFLAETIGRKRIIGLACAILGLGVLVGPDLEGGDTTWWGELAYCMAGLFWTIFTFLMRKWQINPLVGTSLAATFSLPYLLVYGIALDPRIPHLPLFETVVHGLFQGVVFNLIAIMLYNRAVNRLGAASVVATMPLMPAFGTLMEWGVFGRVPHLGVPFALLLMTLGVWLAAGSSSIPTNRSEKQ